MKKLVCPILGIVMFALSACIKSGDNIQTLKEVPAVVGLSFDPFSTTIIISNGAGGAWQFIAPELNEFLDIDLNEGDLLITNFTINYEQQPFPPYTTVSNLTWKKVDLGYPKHKSEAEDDFDVFFENATLWDVIQYNWKDLLFFKFVQKAPADQEFVYEMTYDYNDFGMCTVYIRAKENGTGSQPSAKNSFYYAFDVSDLVGNLSPSNNNVRFNIVFKTGEKDGEEIYQSWVGNPLVLPLRDE